MTVICVSQSQWSVSYRFNFLQLRMQAFWIIYVLGAVYFWYFTDIIIVLHLGQMF